MTFQNQKSEIVDKLSTKLYGWWDAIILRLPNIAIAILVLVLFYFSARFLSNLLLKILRKRMKNQSVRRILSKMLFLLIICIGGFISLGVLDLDKALTSLLAGAGVVALAIGLALQGTLSNTFSGVMLSFLPRIKIGDYIETSEHAGFVHEISLRNLVLRRPDNHYVIMPNSKFIEEPFINYSIATRGRVAVACGVAYGTDLHLVKKLITESFEEAYPTQAGESIQFYFTKFNDSSIDFMVRFWIDFVKKSQMYDAQDKAILLINDLFVKHKITIPFPIRTLDFPSSTQINLKNSNDDPNK